MDRYQIVEKAGQFNHAGSKATADVAAVAETLGFRPTVVHMNTLKDTKPAKAIRQVGYFTDWIGVTRKIPAGAVVLMQHPFHHVQLTREKNLRKLKEEKRVKFISFVHDVEKLRAFRYNDYYCQEFNTMMELADVLIVHNDVMKEYFVQCGFPEEKIVTLGIFDYLQEGEVPQRPEFEPSITIAGNLDTNKCVYIGQLGVLNGVQVQLYGPNFDELMRQYPNIHYHGSFGVDEIPEQEERFFTQKDIEDREKVVDLWAEDEPEEESEDPAEDSTRTGTLIAPEDPAGAPSVPAAVAAAPPSRLVDLYPQTSQTPVSTSAPVSS